MSQGHEEFDQAAEALMADDNATPSPALESLGGVLLAEFQQAELDRRETELRWLQDLRQYRGKYDPDVEAKIAKNRSKAFVRKTRVKVKTVDSKVVDLLFPAGTERNWSLSETPKPRLSGDQKEEINKLLAAIAKQGTTVTREMREQVVLEWAKKRAKSMVKTIDDQLAEARYKQVCIKAIHSGNLYGTGILKGPLVERKVRTRFIKQGKGAKQHWVAQSESYVAPFVDYVPLWRFYPDMSATELDKCRYAYERHLMTKADMGDLAKRRSFRRDAIVGYVTAHPKGEVQLRTIDAELRQIGDRASGQGDVGGRYEVLERWGWLDGQQLRDAGVEVPENRVHESFFSNVWLLPDGQIIKAVLQPINGVTWPYHIYYFDKDESSIFAEGLASIMRDDQTMMNAGTRLMIDNAAITSGPQLEVNPSLLSSMEKIDEFAPWKVWLRNSAFPMATAIRVHEMPSRIDQLSAMVGMFESNADEVTAIPRYVSGENVTQGAAGTASGMSMLMANVNIVIKDLITSFDVLTQGFITGLYYWNMQFNPDDTIKGDYDVKARGVSSLVAKEVRAQSLNNFAQLTANPLDAPFIKRDMLNRQRAEALELVDVVKTEDEIKTEQEGDAAKQQAALQQQVQQLQLAEAKAKVDKLMAEAALTQQKAQEMIANIELIVAKTVATKVEAAYAGLQAGGVATQSPYTAPAADEILRSAGWKDATPNPSIAQLDGPPVQADQGVMRVMNKGQTFAAEPRVGPGGQPVEPNAPMTTQPAEGAPDPATGMVGRREGIETPGIEQA